MKASNVRKAVFLVISTGALALGCELVVDFDRTKIPVEGADSAVETTDASLDASRDDASAADGTVSDSAPFDASDASDASDAAVDAPDAG